MIAPLLTRNVEFFIRNEKLFNNFSGYLLNSRNYSVKGKVSDFRFRNYGAKTARNYITAVGIVSLGLSFAAVPLYRMFCQATGYGGILKEDIEASKNKIENMKKINNRPIRVKFNSDLASNMQWNFKPQQKDIMVFPGETALAFFTAVNPTDEPIIGISTYNVLPFNAAPYFNKVQCFCFEEQMLNPKEKVDLPVFFYIDPEFCEDPNMEFVNEIILSYTFFEAKSGLPLASPTQNKS